MGLIVLVGLLLGCSPPAESVKTTQSSVSSLYAQATSEIARLREEHVAELESMHARYESESAAREGVLQTEIEALRASQVAERVLASDTSAAQLAQATEQQRTAAMEWEAQIRGEHRDHVSSLEAEIESLRAAYSSVCRRTSRGWSGSRCTTRCADHIPHR